MNAEAHPEAYLVLVEAGREGPRYRLGVSTVIGRAPECDVVLASSHVSRRHAEVSWDGGRYLIADLDSLNGTRVNGQSIDAPRVLSSGDTIELADCTLRFQFAVGAETQVFTPQRSGLMLDRATHEVTLHGRSLDLTPKEFLLLALLEAEAPAVVEYARIAAEVWPELEGAVSEDSIAQLATRLRRKLGPHAAIIANVRNFGYRLDDAAAE
jgi:pSer/pThr/pTyr-binding forkhead associated (FHA) protein